MTISSLPNSDLGSTTETIGIFNSELSFFTSWLAESLGPGWTSRSLGHGLLHRFLPELGADEQQGRTRLLLAGFQDWVLMFTNGPVGTDPGNIPTHAVQDLSISAARAVAVDAGSDSYSAALFELFDGIGEPPLYCRRAVGALFDGYKWEFCEFGDPLEFEQTDSYSNRKVRDRLTPALVRDYVAALTGITPSLEAAVAATIVERRS